MRILLIGCVCTAVIVGCKGQPSKTEPVKKNTVSRLSPDNNTLLWKVSGKNLDRPTYLYGTFHLLCKNDISLSGQLKQVIKEVDTVYFEMDLDDPSILFGALLFMNMKGGKELKDLYTPEQYSRIEKYFKDELGTTLTLLSRTKPYWLIAMLYPKMMDCKAPSGVEEELMRLAKDNKKDIKGLETIQFQGSVFDSIPYEWQAKELLKTIDSFSVSKQEFDSMAVIYKNQQLELMDSMIKASSFGGSEYDDILLTKRNKNWVEQLKIMMPEQSLFVAVGAGHLVGENGLISLLRKEGYKVEPLLNK